ncbi:chemotaxis-specific protein-glutamate methyltransferase CheB [Sphingomicrobium nitratireducens]|uniref:chemotaxis-specific protein-glutamate methyltransferase CheB n=1 Tax=Sphingomicrobium nitratireducens TaxID=2964666 RepID=UPI0022406D1D|nr:chemotaxis-specific protein-glutamate methyltransferase CheB [Sphingomicrobium nitratireducens]
MAGLAAKLPDRPTAARPTRLMLVDDSMVARAVLSRMIAAAPEFEIVGVAGTAEDALIALGEVRVDIVLLDLEMPGAGGLKLLPKILEAARGAQVLIVSSLAEDGAEETVAALAMGASDTLPKPGTGRFNGRFSEILLGRLRALASGARRVESPVARIEPGPPVPMRRKMPDTELGLLMIGASTGGIHALGTFFGSMLGRIGAPILVTQHLPEAFMAVFARQLSQAAGRPAHVARDGDRLREDEIYVAPGDHHLEVVERSGTLFARLTNQRVSSACLPSVDPMFASGGAALGERAVGVVLTGMGRDGLEGATKLVACGGAVLAQDEKSCAVWGMPRAIAEAGLAAAALPPEELATLVAKRAGGR